LLDIENFLKKKKIIEFTSKFIVINKYRGRYFNFRFKSLFFSENFS